MRAAPTSSPLSAGFRRSLALAGLVCLPAFAQVPAAAPAALADVPPPAGAKVEQRVERIRVEDGGSRVDEVRYGGQTQSITVQPKAEVPQYEITPTDGTRRRPAARDGAESDTGQRVWRVMGF